MGAVSPSAGLSPIETAATVHDQHRFSRMPSE